MELIAVLSAVFAALALLLDAYAHIFGRQPSLVLTIEPNQDDNLCNFSAVLTNQGTAAAKITHIAYDEDWATIGNDLSVNPLIFFLDCVLLPGQRVKAPLIGDSIARVLYEHHAHPETAKSFFHIRAVFDYQSLGRCLPRRKMQSQTFELNLTSIYARVHTLRPVIPPNTLAPFCESYRAALELLPPRSDRETVDKK